MIRKMYSPFGEIAEIDNDGTVTYDNLPLGGMRVKEYSCYRAAIKALERDGWSDIPFDQRR